MPATHEDLQQRLNTLQIPFRNTVHAPVFTVDEAKSKRGELPGAHCKNLFLRNKKGFMWLVVCLEEEEIDLKHLGAQLGAGRLSFGSADRLMRNLGVIAGAVSPFAVINDIECQVQVVLDQTMMSEPLLNYHPLRNDMTLSITSEDLLRFLRSCQHDPLLLDLRAR